MPAKGRALKPSFADPDDAPAWTAEQFARAEVAFGGKVVRAAQGTLKGPRGRPKKADAKVHIHIRLSPQVLGYFRSTGPGWQTRVDEILRKWVAEKGERPEKPKRGA